MGVEGPMHALRRRIKARLDRHHLSSLFANVEDVRRLELELLGGGL